MTKAAGDCCKVLLKNTEKQEEEEEEGVAAANLRSALVGIFALKEGQ